MDCKTRQGGKLKIDCPSLSMVGLVTSCRGDENVEVHPTVGTRFNYRKPATNGKSPMVKKRVSSDSCKHAIYCNLDLTTCKGPFQWLLS